VQTYYYNARTRESAWSKPDNAKVITQAEMEAMVASGQPLPGSSAGASRSGPSSVSQTTPAQQGMSPSIYNIQLTLVMSGDHNYVGSYLFFKMYNAVPKVNEQSQRSMICDYKSVQISYVIITQTC